MHKLPGRGIGAGHQPTFPIVNELRVRHSSNRRGRQHGMRSLTTHDPEAIAEVLTAEGGSQQFLLRTIADAMPQMVWSTRADGFHDYFNQRWYDFTGVPPGSTDGEGWNGIFHPEDQPLAWERWKRSLETGALYEIEYRLRRRDGVYRWVLGRALPLRDDRGRIIRWFGTCTDVHEMKRTEAELATSEARFRSLVESTAAVVWRATPDGELSPEETGWSMFTGQAPDEYSCWGWLEAVHPDDREATQRAWAASVGARSAYGIEHRLRRRDGEYRHMLVRATPIVDTYGRLTEWVGTHTDITELKTAETELRQLNDTLEAKIEMRTVELVQARVALEKVNRDLERIVLHRTEALTAANEEIKRFAYIVSHDLRAPLVNIMGFTSELEAAQDVITGFHRKAVEIAPDLAGGEMQAIVDGEFQEAIGFIRSSTEKMDRLINAILTLSRTERRMLTAERIDMRAFLSAFKQSLAHQFAAQEVDFSVAEIPDVVSDRLALEQIFANLIENAVKYLATGRPGRIEITGRDDGDHVSYTVTDNGRGIDAKDFERIFELFRRAGVQDKPGEGIGLAHVRALVRRLGGRIDVVSTPNVGSSFTVTLPKALQTE